MKRIGLVDIHPFKHEWCGIPETDEFKIGDQVVVRDVEGEELGKIKYLAEDDDAKIFIVRKATPEDVELAEQLKQEAKTSFELFCKMLVEFDLKIKPIDAHCRFDQSKTCFYIYTEIHQDFRIFTER